MLKEVREQLLLCPELLDIEIEFWANCRLQETHLKELKKLKKERKQQTQRE